MAQNLYKNKIQMLKETLSQGLLEKDEIISLVLLCMIAGKSVFLYGPPGTAKSLISRRVSCAFKSNKFFDYLMNRFSTPEEVFGPLKLSELRQDRLVRSVEGFLPSADFAFLDEIWKSSPAILNSLLTIINEKQFRNGKDNIKVPLRGLVAASNELPQKGQSLEALYDRFIMRLIVPPLKQKANFKKLLQSSGAKEIVNVADELKFYDRDFKQIKSLVDSAKIDESVLNVLELLRSKIEAYNDKKADDVESIYVSERRWVAIMELLKFSAVLSDRQSVGLIDLALLKHCLWSEESQKEEIEKMLKECLDSYSPQAIKNGIDIKNLAKQIELTIKNPVEQVVKDSLLKEVANVHHKLYQELQKCLSEANDFKDKNANPFVSKSGYDIFLSSFKEAQENLEQDILEVKKLQDKVKNAKVAAPIV